MQNESQPNGDFKAQRTPFLKFYTDDWRSGTLGLSFELKGFYIDLLALMWDRKANLPNDPEHIARSLQCDPRKVRRLIGELIAAGKLTVEAEELTNRRMIRELGEHKRRSSSAKDREEIARKSRRSPAEVQPKSMANESKTETNSTDQKPPLANTRVPIPDSRDRIDSPAVLGDSRASSPSFAALPSGFLERLTKAAEPCLDNPVNCLGLLSGATPMMWLAQGCDAELDILPTITAAGQKYRGKRVRDWGYFTGMVAEARSRRLAGLPSSKPTASAKPPAPARRLKSEDELYDEMIAEAKAMGLVDEHQLR